MPRQQGVWERSHVQLRVLSHTAAQAQPVRLTHQVYAMGVAAQLELQLAALEPLLQ